MSVSKRPKKSISLLLFSNRGRHSVTSWRLQNTITESDVQNRIISLDLHLADKEIIIYLWQLIHGSLPFGSIALRWSVVRQSSTTDSDTDSALSKWHNFTNRHRTYLMCTHNWWKKKRVISESLHDRAKSNSFAYIWNTVINYSHWTVTRRKWC